LSPHSYRRRPRESRSQGTNDRCGDDNPDRDQREPASGAEHRSSRATAVV